MCGVLAALSLAHSNPPLNNASESEIRPGSRAHGHAARLARDAGNPDGIREAAEEEEEEERASQREDEE